MAAINSSRPLLADNSSTASSRYSRRLRNNDSDRSGWARAAWQPCFKDSKEQTRFPLSTLETKKGGNAVESLVSYQFRKCPLNLGNSFACAKVLLASLRKRCRVMNPKSFAAYCEFS